MPHISQWSLSWQTMASPWLQISAMHLDSRHSARQRQAGWQIHSLRSPGGKMGMHRVGFSQKQVISLKTFTVVFMCAEAVPALCHSALCPLDLPCTQAQLICSVSQWGNRNGQLRTCCFYHLTALWGNLSAPVQSGLGNHYLCAAHFLPKHNSNSEKWEWFWWDGIVKFSLKMPFCAGIHSHNKSCTIKWPQQLLHPSYQLAQIKSVSFENLSP